MEKYKKLKKYNNFYKNNKAREILLELNKHKCKGCEKEIFLNKDYHIGHIIPQKDAEKFEQIFNGLDVNNIINLHPLCSKCNLKANHYQTYSFFMLNQMYNENLRIIENRLEKIINKDEFKKINEILFFLEKNKNIDLYNKNGKKIKNQTIVKIIYQLFKIKSSEKEYEKITYIEEFKNISEIYCVDIIYINNKKINELTFFKLSKKIKKDEMIIKNTKKNIYKIKNYIEEIGDLLG